MTEGSARLAPRRPAKRAARRRPLPYRLDVHVVSSGARAAMAADVRAGLTASPKWLLPKYFYDDRGCELFEAITLLPEYYQTRTELALLRAEAPGIVARHGPTELLELGSGSSHKTRALLDAMRDDGGLRRYLPFDISPGALLAAAGRLAEDYAGVRVRAVAGDFERHLGRIPAPPRGGRRLVAFLGGTVGNLHPAAREPFLRSVRMLLRPEDRLLVGTDLVGDRARIEAAYNDAAGVTAAFNLNLLSVLNAELDGDLDPRRFEHVAFYDADFEWIEMRLRAREAHTARLRALDLAVPFAAGEEVRTELSCKFTRASVERMYADAGLELLEWRTDPRGWFAISLAAPA
ncbi:MAG: L-histidine Nalpha-methyltransferase [Miltoncostaeaceae bacterium]|jgi:L-histidine N-alpha-methyltransferase|nr:L-histidine Nalpha-methyltransferase [Miltoncostaeaceae bacterium]